MRRVLLLAGLVALGGASMVASALQPSEAQTIDVVKVKENLYVLTSSTPGDPKTFSGGNVAVFITDAGVVLVDTKLAGWGQTLLARIKSVTDKPVTTLINTHTHGDHTGNNALFGATVDSVVHENTKANMTRMDAYKGENAKFLPKRTYTSTLSIGSGKDRVDLYHFGPGHTDGDTFVVFPALRVMHTGDMFAWKDAPFLDRSNGGSGVQMPQTLAKVLATVKDVDTIIPGHSPVTSRKDLEEFQRFTSDLLAATQAARKAGKTVDEASASIDLSGKYPAYTSARVKAAVQAIYDELTP
ncbi:MAG: MBL fold metallo-hydrolase [Vicinamibacterales bacterium]|mgnify:CR=1 FL=1